MKKIIYITITLAILLAFTSCGGRNANPDLSAFGSGGSSGGGPGGGAENGLGSGTGGGMENSGALSLEEALASGAAMQYDRAVLYDQALGCEAVRSVMPAGWSVAGEASWIFQSGEAPAVLDFKIISPEMDEQCGYISATFYVEPEQPHPLYGQWTRGQIMNDSLAPAREYQAPADFMVEMLGGYFGAAGLEIIESEYPDAETRKLMDEAAARREQMLNELYSQSSANSQVSCVSNVIVDGIGITFRFTSQGEEYICKAACLTVQSIDHFTSSFFNTVINNWFVPDIRYYIAKTSKFNAQSEVCEVFFNSLIVNEQWNNAVTQAVARVFQDKSEREAKEFAQLQQVLQQQAQSISNSMNQNYSYSAPESSGYDTNVMGGWTNVLTDQSYYEAPDGGHVLLNYNDYHYTDGNSIYSSSQPLDTVGTGLSQLTELGTMGGD